MAVQRNPPDISPEEYFEIERTSDVRSEYISGEMFAMASPSYEHGQIMFNLSAELSAALRDQPCNGK